jgi:guanosine-3',5'-bis(diphosphate) 3'-pyrophosphohydrolase
MITTAETLEKAIIFCVNAHQGQYRKGDGRPYVLHPLSVASRISAIKKSTNPYLIGCAAMLHDTVEDCKEKGITLEVIAKEFGYKVAALVAELTLDKTQYATIGKERYLAEEMRYMSSYAFAIKLADRLDNVSDMAKMDESFQRKYVKETIYILKSLK